MAEETLVAVFDTVAAADAAVVALVRQGFRLGEVERHANAALAIPAGPAEGSGFWSALFGGETTAEQNMVYDRTVRAGGDVVTVLLHDGERDADRVMAALERFGPIDVAGRAASYRMPDGAAGMSGQTLLLSEESLAVGRRAVSRGATRLRRFVQTRAVAGDVTLRDERVSVTRRTAAAAAPAGPDAFTDPVLEMTEHDEELVVSKTARVREEVILHREVTERIETVRETLRREEVEVERLDAPAAARD